MSKLEEIKERLQNSVLGTQLAVPEDIFLYDIEYLLSRLEIAEKALEKLTNPISAIETKEIAEKALQQLRS